MSQDQPKVETSRKLAVINAASSIVTHVINLTILVWVQRYLLRHVSIAEYSLFPLVAAPMTFLPVLTSVLTAGIGRYTVAAYARGDERRVTEIVSTMTPLLFAAGVGVLLLGASFIYGIDSFLEISPDLVDDARWMMTIMMLSAALRVSLAAFGVGIFIRQKFVLGNIIDLGSQVLRLVLLAVFLFGIDTRVLWVVLATTLANTSGFICRLVLSRRLVKGIRLNLSAIRWSVAPEIISFGTWSFLQQVTTSFRYSAVVFMLNHFAAEIHLASFYLGRLVTRQLQQLTTMAFRPLAPPLVAMWAKGETDRIRAVYLNGGRYALWLVAFVAFPAFVFGPKAVHLYLRDTKADVHLTIQVMLIAMFVLTIRFGNIMMGRIANAAGRAKEACRIVLTSHAAVLAFMVLFIVYLHLGALGAALGMLAGNLIVIPCVALPYAFRLTGVSPSRWVRETFMPGLVPGLAASVAWWSLFLTLKPESWAGLFLCGLAGCPVYALVLYRIGMKPRERQDLGTLLQKAKKKVFANL